MNEGLNQTSKRFCPKKLKKKKRGEIEFKKQIKHFSLEINKLPNFFSFPSIQSKSFPMQKPLLDQEENEGNSSSDSEPETPSLDFVPSKVIKKRKE